MRKWLVMLLLSMSVVLTSCAALDRMLLDDNNDVKDDVKTTLDLTEEVGYTAGTMGMPWGVIAGAIATAASAAIGVYANTRKKQQLSEADDTLSEAEQHRENFELVLSGIVAAVEDVSAVDIGGQNIGDLVKQKIEEKFRGKDIYEMAKVVISIIKAANEAEDSDNS